MKIQDHARKYLPLTESTYYILISLIEPLHGYGIMQNVEEISKGKVKIGPGTLYGAINKLLKEELIVRAKSKSLEDDRRKTYVLTDIGKEVVIQEYRRLSDLVECSKEVVNKIGGVEND